MIKLKKLIKEHSWDRKFGEPLPTLEDVAKKHQIEEKESINEDEAYKAWQKADRDWKKEQRKIEQIVKKFFSKHDIDVDDRDIYHKLGEIEDDMDDLLVAWSDDLVYD